MVDRAIERTQYWVDPKDQIAVRDGPPALAETFADLEQYLLPLQQLRTAALHGWGVGDGLRVAATPGAAGITVGQGTALDARGRQIVLAPGGVAVTDQGVDAGEIQNVPTVPIGADGKSTVPTTGIPQGEYLLTVTWREVLGDNDFVNANTWLHAPWLRLIPPSGFSDVGTQVVLARVSLGADGKVADGGLTAGPRRTVGVQAGRLLLRAPRGSGGGADPLAVDHLPVAEVRAEPEGDVVLALLGDGQARTALTVEQATGRTRVAGGLTVTGVADFAGDTRFTGTLTAEDVVAADISAGTLSVWGSVKAGDVRAAAFSGETLSVTGAVQAGDIATADLTIAGRLRMGNTGPSQAAFVVVDERPDNNWNTAAFQKPTVGPNWSHLHWGATGDWYIRSAASSGRVILQDTGGRVGVGTGAPQANLDVAGSMALNGRLAFSSDSWLRLNQGLKFESGVHTPGLFTAGSVNVGGVGGWGNPGFGNLTVAGGLTTAGIIQAFQYRTDGQAWLNGQVFTGEVFGHWSSKATLKLFNSNIWDGDGVLSLRSGGGGIVLRDEVWVEKVLHKSGGGFKIDHPGEPGDKYLSHSFVESPEMVNLYAGVVVTGDDSSARVQLPDYFQTLNRDVRFQLTALGRLALATVEGDVEGNAFRIRTDQPGVTVSWQVTGVRQDPWAEANRIAVVEDKPDAERGRFLHPQLYGQADERATSGASARSEPAVAVGQAPGPSSSPLLHTPPYVPPDTVPSATAAPTPAPRPRGGIR